MGAGTALCLDSSYERVRTPMSLLLCAKRPGSLSPENVISRTRELDAAGTLGVGFGGGEPTAHPPFAWLCAWVTEQTQFARRVTPGLFRGVVDAATSPV